MHAHTRPVERVGVADSHGLRAARDSQGEIKGCVAVFCSIYQLLKVSEAVKREEGQDVVKHAP